MESRVQTMPPRAGSAGKGAQAAPARAGERKAPECADEFDVGGVHVRVSFAGRITIEEALARMLGARD